MDPNHSERSWERLCRVLMLKLAAKLRQAKKQVRYFERRLKERQEIPAAFGQIGDALKELRQLEDLLVEARGIEREANNTFQGAKEWWNALAPKKENA